MTSIAPLAMHGSPMHLHLLWRMVPGRIVFCATTMRLGLPCVPSIMQLHRRVVPLDFVGPCAFHNMSPIMAMMKWETWARDDSLLMMHAAVVPGRHCVDDMHLCRQASHCFNMMVQQQTCTSSAHRREQA